MVLPLYGFTAVSLYCLGAKPEAAQARPLPATPWLAAAWLGHEWDAPALRLCACAKPRQRTYRPHLQSSLQSVVTPPAKPLAKHVVCYGQAQQKKAMLELRIRHFLSQACARLGLLEVGHPSSTVVRSDLCAVLYCRTAGIPPSHAPSGCGNQPQNQTTLQTHGLGGNAGQTPSWRITQKRKMKKGRDCALPCEDWKLAV